MKEINEIWYTIKSERGEIYETTDKADARLALREGRDVAKNTRKLFRSGKSDIRIYVSTEISQVKDL